MSTPIDEGTVEASPDNSSTKCTPRKSHRYHITSQHHTTETLTVTRNYEGPVISIVVVNGKTRNTYNIHKNLLLLASPFFGALSNFKEGSENQVVLEDVSELAFRHIQHWLYNGCLDPGLSDDVHTLIKIWVTGDRLLMTTCKNKIIDDLRDRYRLTSATMEHLKLAASYGYGPDRALVNYLMDQLVWDQLHDWVAHKEDFAEKYYRELSADVLAALFKKKDVLARWSRRQLGNDVSAVLKNPSSEQPCLYHEHCEGEECYLKKKRPQEIIQ